MLSVSQDVTRFSNLSLPLAGWMLIAYSKMPPNDYGQTDGQTDGQTTQRSIYLAGAGARTS